MTRRAVRLLVMGVGALLAWCAWAGPASALTVAVAPAETTVTLGDSFTLRVVCNDAFPDLKGYQLIHGFDASILQYLGHLDGDVLAAGLHQVLTYPTATPDSIWLDTVMLQGTTSTPGVLMYLQFYASAKGDSPIACYEADFRDSNNVRSVPVCAAGLVHVVGPTPVRPTSWGRLKIKYR